MTSHELNIWNSSSTAASLEDGELLHLPVCPFPLPQGDDAAFLRSRQFTSVSRHEISFDPLESKLRGVRFTSETDADRLASIMRDFSNAATGWLANELPEYLGKWTRDRVTLRTEEEATRLSRHHARYDLLHIDNFPDRPTTGKRILRLFVNINPDEPRVWVTSNKFSSLLERFQRRNRVPALSEAEWSAPLNGIQRLMQRDWSGRPAYDSFMLKLQQFMRTDDEFQDKAPKRLWHFQPGSAWLLFADGLSHAVLRGQYALEHSYFVPQSALVQPERSPLRQLVEAGETNRLQKAG